MATQILNLPINIPWKQIAVSPDMMDTRFGDKQFPAEWRSSLAISAFEPRLEELPEELCEERITYLKITCSITGYQPTKEETEKIYDASINAHSELDRLLEEYFACYGVLLNVAVFPAGKDMKLSDYPHIVVFEPKVRDFYQAATESGEILTSSQSGVKTDKSLINTEQTETGFAAEIPIVDNKGNKIGGISGHRARTDTDQDQWTVETDASRERRETQGATTQLSQMYNLLTGYHQGTNRAAFLMLPRPHVLQPTDNRTFVQGLRYIEGIQEFMLVVLRPRHIDSMCVEVFLETGHFPEGDVVEQPEPEYNTKTKDFTDGPVIAPENGRTGSRTRVSLNRTFTGFELDGWEFDPEAVAGTNGVEELEKFPDDNAGGTSGGGLIHPAKPSLDNYQFSAETPDKVIITGSILSYVTDNTVFHRKYRVHLRKPKTNTAGPLVDFSKLVITSRGISVCFRSGKICPEVMQVSDRQAVYKESIVDERSIKINSVVLTNETSRDSRLPAMKELLRQIQSAMTTSWRLPSRYPAGQIGFLESDYFKNRIKAALPKERLDMPLGQISGLPEQVVKSLGEKSTVGEALEMDLPGFARKTGLSIEESAKARRILLGFTPTTNKYES